MRPYVASVTPYQGCDFWFRAMLKRQGADKAAHATRFDAIVTSDRLPPDDQGGRVLRFRPRGAPPRGGWRWAQGEPDSPVDDLAKYERSETSDDYRHRMTMNLLTLVFALMLIAGGVWLTTKLVENRNLQDCFLSGRRNCAPIAVPSRQQT
jgi:hypothetical protein